MIIHEKLTLERIYLLSDDYEEFIFCKDKAKFKLNYQECHLVTRAVYNEEKKLYELEPNRIYKCKIGEDNQSNPLKSIMDSPYYICDCPIITLLSGFITIGVTFLGHDIDNIYIKNDGTNPIYIEPGADIAECTILYREDNGVGCNG